MTIEVPSASDRRSALDRTERWFLSRGIPHFIAGYSASRDVFTRALPGLTLIVLFEVAVALNFSWPVWLNALAAGGGLALLVMAWALVNAARRRRPLLARPDRVGPVEVTLFVVLPGLLPLAFGGQVLSAVATAVTNALLLGLIYLFTSYGIAPMFSWAAGRLFRQLGALLGLLVRALPLLLLFVTFLFLNVEVWQVASTLTGPFFWATLGLFAVVGIVFLAARLPGEVARLATFESWAAVVSAVQGTPIESLAVQAEPPGGPSNQLSRREWGNAGLVVLFSQGLQVLFVAAMIGVFLVAFGLLTVNPELMASWTGRPPNELAVLDLWGQRVPVTEELLRVTGFLAAFSGLYFSVYAITDATYRQEFFDEVAGEVREAFAVRAAYLAALGSGT